MAVASKKILIVDDHPLFRDAVTWLINTASDLQVVNRAGTGADARELARREPPDVAIIDVLIPDVSGITLAREIVDEHPGCRVMGLSVIDDPVVVTEMLRAGASGYACKSQGAAQILKAIRTVIAGERCLPPGVTAEQIDRHLREVRDEPVSRLTRREHEVFELLIRGHSNDEIAVRLDISRRTVETHRLRLTRKLCVQTIPEMQRLAARYDIVSADADRKVRMTGR
jgi:DNA-binding NarL/FixJ family response regulator